MDGFKVRAKLALNFPRALTTAEAEDIMMQYARAFASAVECELSNGDLPFEEHELFQRITDQVTALPKKNVRLIGLHVWHKGAVSSGSMLAVNPEENGGPTGNPTVPAMPAVRPPAERTVSSNNLQAALTAKPPAPAPTSSPMSTSPVPGQGPESKPIPGLPRRSRLLAATGGTATPAASPSVETATTPPNRGPAVSGVTTRVAAPAARTPNASSSSAQTSATVATAASSAARSAGAARVSSSTLAKAPNTTGAFPAAARMASGVVPAVEPRIRTKSSFASALERCVEGQGEDLGRGLAQPVRDAAAEALFAALGALTSSLTDPLALLDGRADPELRRGIVGEACVYVCYVLYEALTRTSLPQIQAIQVVQGACTQALLDQDMPVSEISRYLATESPREEFSGRLCTLFGVRETPDMQQRVDAHLRSLRIDVRACAEQLEQRLTRAKAAGDPRTG
jgi:hypothetical protein